MVRTLPKVLAYRIDAADRIVLVDEGWRGFAAANGAPALAEGAVGTSIWDHIHGHAVGSVYNALFRELRAGGSPRKLRFALRCDAPDKLRELEMEIEHLGGGELEIRTMLVREQPRAPIRVLDTQIEHAGELAILCAWCHAIKDGERWVPLEEGVANLGLFTREKPPQVSHGICPECRTRVMGSIKRD